jgi:predicted DNA-binding protein
MYYDCEYILHAHEPTMSTLTLRLPDELDARLSRLAALEDKSRSELARAALEGFLQEQERKRFMSELVEEARAAYATETILEEAHEIAETFLPLDNAALDAAEGRKAGETVTEESGGDKWWK